MSIVDQYALQRFVNAQQGTYSQALMELTAGEKRSHWMWFIFPQIAGLGMSEMARRYAIQSLDEATAYLAHPVLGDRLRACTALVNAVEEKSMNQIFGSPDDMKFHSSVTLFACVEQEPESVFHKALQRYFDGQQDTETLAILRAKMK